MLDLNVIKQGGTCKELSVVWFLGNVLKNSATVCLRWKPSSEMFHLSIKGEWERRLGFRWCKNSTAEPGGRLRGRQCISCKPLCVSRVFGSYFKFRQKKAERLPGKQCSAGTDLALCLCLHKNSLQRCWIEVGPISCSDKVRCLWLRSIIASFSSLSTSHRRHQHHHHLLPTYLISLHASPLGMQGDHGVWRVEIVDSSR